MKNVVFAKQHRLDRRTALRAAGSVLALPLLDAMTPAFAKPTSNESEAPRRLIGICSDLSLIPDNFLPKTAGANYKDSLYTAVLKKHRSNLTVLSGLYHPECTGGHATEDVFLTGARHPKTPGFRNSISIDQLAADQFSSATRFPSLTLRVGPGAGSIAYSANGVRIPAEARPSLVYRRLFLQGSKDEIEQEVGRLRDGQSLMDRFSDQVQSLQKKVGTRDKERLDQYFTAFRELEQRLALSAEWEQKPKPTPKGDYAKEPKDEQSPEALIERTRLMYALARAALETDSTRFVTIFVTQGFNPKVDLPGVELPHHALTHQQTRPDTREQLQIIELAQLGELDRLLTGLTDVQEERTTLLDRTMVLYGSNMGNAGSHSNTNLPILLAGGGFKHGQHLAFDPNNNLPLCNLYVSMLQRLGIETDRFSTSTGTLRGLEFKS